MGRRRPRSSRRWRHGSCEWNHYLYVGVLYNYAFNRQVELPTRFNYFQAIPADLWREFWERTRNGIHFELMNADERFGVQTLLNVFIYFADNHDVAEEAWHEFVLQLEMAALISSARVQQHHAGGPVHVEDDHVQPLAEPEHAEWFVYGVALWASGQWPVCFWNSITEISTYVNSEHLSPSTGG